MIDLKTFLQNFLNTIDYPDDKEKFISKLLFAIYSASVDEAMNTLPQDKQTSIKQQLQTVPNFESLQQIINNNFDQSIFQEALKRNSEKVFSEYIDTIDPVLSGDQKSKLQAFLVLQKLV